ncbi:hypothetical protein [Catellatospora sichuanensis]|uniref:hypothetical protein n=1 Tax=Catellatospora sichuanensis TaxID=1969805 RepID=UPI001183EBD9|nr:hypothetical protein [Catellatospora sichuanensis]
MIVVPVEVIGRDASRVELVILLGQVVVTCRRVGCDKEAWATLVILLIPASEVSVEIDACR